MLPCRCPTFKKVAAFLLATYNLKKKSQFSQMMDVLPKLDPCHLRNRARKLVRAFLIDWTAQKVNENFCAHHLKRGDTDER